MKHSLDSVYTMLDKQLEHPALSSAIASVEKSLKSVPHLPVGLVQVLGKVSPWLVLVGGILGVYGSFGTISYGLGSSPYWSAWVETFARIPRGYFLFSGIIQLVSGLLLLLAFKPLKAYEKRGWLIIALNQVLSVVMMVISLVFSVSSLLSSLVGVALGVYLLFEVKPLYYGKIKQE